MKSARIASFMAFAIGLLIIQGGVVRADTPPPSDDSSQLMLSGDLKLAVDQGVVSAQDAEKALKVQQGSYDVIALTEQANSFAGATIQATLSMRYAGDLLEWIVHEPDGKWYVYAYPIVLDAENRADSKSVETRGVLSNTLNSKPAAFPVTTNPQHDEATNRDVITQSCQLIWVNLFEHAFYLGAIRTIDGCNGGGWYGISNLSSIGFDNITSSHTMTSGVDRLRLFDGTYYFSYLGESIDNNTAYFSDWNDKMSSVSILF